MLVAESRMSQSANSDRQTGRTGYVRDRPGGLQPPAIACRVCTVIICILLFPRNSKWSNRDKDQHKTGRLTGTVGWDGSLAYRMRSER